MHSSGSPARFTIGLATVAGVVCGLLFVTVVPASAACHAFTVEADPSVPDEGATVTVTIRRDADVQPSSVRVRTVDETATGGSDYTPLDERVEFTDGTEQTREIDILDDGTSEDDETFVIELSEGEGCEVNQSFTYDSVTVTIQDDDPATDESSTADESADDDQTQEQDEAQEQGTAGDMPDTGGAFAGVGLLGVLAAEVLLRRRRRNRRS